MNTLFRRVVLAITVAIGAYVGLWAAFFPEAFYSSFPGLGLHWIHLDGPYNEHLIRDVGALHLGLGAGSLAAAISRDAMPGRVVGLAWSLFGVLHFGYHALHPEGATVDVALTIISLGLSALLGIVLMFPLRGRAEHQEATTMEVRP